MTYSKAIHYLNSFVNYEKIPAWPYKESLKLERIKGFLETIDNPQNSLRCIHIAGTKGKGSTCAFVAYILKEAGFKVGLYTSPHLSDFRERIRVLSAFVRHKSWRTSADARRSFERRRADFEGMISKEELTVLVERLKPAIEKYNKRSKYDPLSFFEVYTALAFVYFKEKKVDFAVLETGLGGRLDATNVVNPLVCAITPISYEHTEKLGNTLTEIAGEKAGIIKIQNPKSLPGRPAGKIQNLVVISAPQEKEVREVIRNRCKEVSAKLYEVGKDRLYKNGRRQVLSVKGIFGEYKDLKINLLGRHQVINATVAVGIIEALRFYNTKVDIASIRRGLHNTLWPARFEIISKRPLIVLDGAQNKTSASTLRKTVRQVFPDKKICIIFGISKDKELKDTCQEIEKISERIILTKADNPRASEPKDLLRYFKNNSILLTNSTKEAINLAREKAEKNDIIVVTGSLYICGEIRKLFINDN